MHSIARTRPSVGAIQQTQRNPDPRSPIWSSRVLGRGHHPGTVCSHDGGALKIGTCRSPSRGDPTRTCSRDPLMRRWSVVESSRFREASTSAVVYIFLRVCWNRLCISSCEKRLGVPCLGQLKRQSKVVNSVYFWPRPLISSVDLKKAMKGSNFHNF